MGEKETASEAFYERNLLALLYARGWWLDRTSGWKLLLIDSPAGQLTYHVPLDFETFGLPEIEPLWDGHTTEEKHQRMKKYLEWSKVHRWHSCSCNPSVVRAGTQTRPGKYVGESVVCDHGKSWMYNGVEWVFMGQTGGPR